MLFVLLFPCLNVHLVLKGSLGAWSMQVWWKDGGGGIAPSYWSKAQLCVTSDSTFEPSRSAVVCIEQICCGMTWESGKVGRFWLWEKSMEVRCKHNEVGGWGPVPPAMAALQWKVLSVNFSQLWSPFYGLRNLSITLSFPKYFGVVTNQ